MANIAGRLAARVEEYQKDGDTKGKYVQVGVLINGDNGQYAILDPSVNLAGCLTKQNMMNHANGKKPRGSLMVSVFTDQHNGQQNNQQSGGAPAMDDLDDDIPF